MLPKVNTFSFLDKWKKKKKHLQPSILNTEVEIARLLKRLQQHLVIITAKFPSDPETYNASIIRVDFKNKLFHLDELVPDTGNTQIKTLKKVLLRTRLDGATLAMDCSLKDLGEEKGLSHYVMAFPRQVKSIQRRESYRVSIPLNKRFQVNMQTESGNFIAGFLNDISYSGIAIRLETPQNFDLKVGANVPFLTLHLDETITCEMEVKRISTILGNTVISSELKEISPAQQREIQKFIARQDREKRRNEIARVE